MPVDALRWGRYASLFLFRVLLLLAFKFMLLSSWAYAQGNCLGDRRVDAGYELANNDVCEGDLVEVANNTEENGNTNAIYYWSWGDGQVDTTFDGANPPPHVYEFDDDEACSFFGIRVLELRLDVRVPGCPQYDHFVIKPIYVYLEPEPLFDQPSYICLPDLEVSFANQSCAYDSLLTYEWDFGDPASGPENSSTEANPSHTFSGPGTYDVRLRIANFCGSKTETKQVIVLESPLPDFEWRTTPASACAPLRLEVTNTSVAVDTYFWEVESADGQARFIGGTQAEDEEPRWRLEEPGLYTVRLFGTSDCGTTFLEKTLEVYAPAAVELVEEAPACESLVYTPSVRYEGDIESYRWTFTGGNPAASSEAFPSEVRFDEPGTYPVIVEVGSVCGDRADTIVLRVLGRTAVNLPAVDPLCSSSDTIRLAADPPGGTWTGLGVRADGLFDPALGNIGPNRLTYAYGPDGCRTEADLTLEILASEPLDLGDGEAFCESSSEAQLTGFSPQGGYWTGPGIVDSAQALLDPSVLEPGAYELRYTYLDPDQGCVSRGTRLLTIDEQPTLALRPDTVTFCTGAEAIELSASVQLDAQPAGGAFRWSGPGVIDPERGRLSTAEIDGEGLFDLRVDYQRGTCAVSDSLALQVIPPEPARAGPDSSVCVSGEFLDLRGQPAGGVWAGPGIEPGSSRIRFDQLPGDGQRTFTYTYTIFPNSTCTQVDDVDLRFIDFSNVSAGEDPAVCAGSGVLTLPEAEPAGGRWRGPQILDSLSGQVDVDLLPAGEHSFRYRIADPDIGCAAEDELTLTIHPLPQGSIDYQGLACTGEAIGFSPELEYATTYAWSFGDGNGSAEEAPTHSYSTAGPYSVNLQATSVYGCSDQFALALEVNEPPPLVRFVPDVRELCSDASVQFDNRSQGAEARYIWDFGNGRTDSAATPGPVVFSTTFEDTTYRVSLLAANACGERSFLDSIRVLARPVARFGAQVNRFCSGDTIALRNASYGNPDRFAWSIDGEAVSDSRDLPPFQVLTEEGVSRTINLRVANQCGVDERTQVLDILPTDVEAFFQLDKTTWCQGDTVRLTNLATAGVPVAYSFGDTNGSAAPDPAFVYAEPGAFTITQTAYGCGYDTAQIEVLVRPSPVSAFEAQALGCSGREVQLDNRSEGAVAYDWRLDGQPFSALRDPDLVLDTPGTYALQLGVRSEHGCLAHSEMTLQTREIDLQPDLEVLPISCHAASDGLIDVLGVSGGRSPYVISLQGDNGYDEGGLSHMGLAPGTYALRIADDGGCELDSQIVMRDPDPLHLRIVASAQTLRLGDSVTLGLQHNLTEPAIRWRPAEGLSCPDCPFPQAAPQRTTTYVAQLQNDRGCLIQDSLRLRVDAARAVFFPNAFSPDNDGHNDRFRPLSEDPGVELVRSFKVYDRWGELMYEATDFRPGDASIGWDGRSRGRHDLQPGVFTWVADVAFIDGQVIQYAGDVTLIR